MARLVVTRDVDKGFKEALAQAAKVRKNPVVTIGLQGSGGGKQHGETGATVAEVATFNEFGTRNIPERSFIRSTMDENVKDLLALNKSLFYRMAEGKVTTAQALTILGLKIQALIKAKITNLRTPPNAPSTIAKKKSSNPLIDTGLMRNSVTFVVHEGGVSALAPKESEPK
jgi:hypothetical protein